MLLSLIHRLIVVIYLVAPVVAVSFDALRARPRARMGPSGGMLATICFGILLGTGLAILFALAAGGKVRIGQAMLAAYFAVGLLVILRLFDWAVRRGLGYILRVNQEVEKPSMGFRLRIVLASLARMAVLFVIGLPYVMAAIMTYRPKIALPDNPQQQLGFAFENVSFAATDGTSISGWWIPGEEPRGRRALRYDDSTIIICHGLAANKSNQLVLSRGFVPFGYNVLIFDFRAHGGSGGQLSSFGDLERRDVLGAVRYLQANRAEQAKHIFGVGASMGAAALIAAAAEPSGEGQAIEAIAALGTYDSLRAEMRFVAEDRFIAPFTWAIEHFGLSMASAQVGTALNDFSPASLVHNLWPRPIFIVHGMDDEIIGFDRGRTLFDSAQQPKQHLWIDKADHNEIINDDTVSQRLRQFFQQAQPVPVI